MKSHPWVAARRKTPNDDPYKHLYQSVRWRKMRAIHLAAHPLCEDCIKENITTPANTVDHIIPVRSGKVDFFDMSNWQSLCEEHHQKKRAAERGTINYSEQHGEK